MEKLEKFLYMTPRRTHGKIGKIGKGYRTNEDCVNWQSTSFEQVPFHPCARQRSGVYQYNDFPASKLEYRNALVFCHSSG